MSLFKQLIGIMPPRVTIHGTGGVGKTTMASQAPKPAFIFTETGRGNIPVEFGLETESYAEVLKALNELATSDHDRQTLVIDSLDHLEPLNWSHICEHHDKDSIEAFGYGRGYKEALSEWRELFRRIDALIEAKNMAVVLIAHSQVKRFDDPVNESYDRYQIKLHESASALVYEWSDVVGYAHKEVVTTKSDTGFGNQRNRGISTGVRVLQCQETASAVAKNRYSIPEKIDLSWSALSSYFNPNTKSQDVEF